MPVIEVLVAVGDTVTKDQGLVTLESDKATMEVPSRAAGVVKELKVKVGDKLSEGSVVAVARSRSAPQLRLAAVRARPPREARERAASPRDRAHRPPHRHPSRLPQRERRPQAPPAAAATGRKADIECQHASCSAPAPAATPPRSAPPTSAWTPCWSNATPRSAASASTSAAFRRRRCCTRPRVIDEAAHASDYGIDFGEPKIDLDKLRAYKDKVVGQLTKGLAGMAKQRKVRVVAGTGKFVSPNEIEVDGDGRQEAGALRAMHHRRRLAGGEAAGLPVGRPAHDGFDRCAGARRDAEETAGRRRRHHRPGDGRVYRALGSEVTVVELLDQLMPGADPDLVQAAAPIA